MKKEALVHLNGLMFETARYVDEKFQDVEIEIDSIVDNKGLAKPQEFNRKKSYHKKAVLEIGAYLEGRLQDQEVEIPEAEPVIEGEELEVHEEDSGIFYFYDDGERVYKHSTRQDNISRSEVLIDMACGDSYVESRRRHYKNSDSGAATRGEFEALLNSEEKMKEEYVEDMRLFVREKLDRASPV